MNFERNLRTIADSDVHMSLHEAIRLSDALVAAATPTPKPIRELFDLTTHDGRVAWVQQDSVCMDFLNRGMPINAIKRLRDVSPCGLKEAKDAIDAVRLH